MHKPTKQPALWCLKSPDGTLLYKTLTNPATSWDAQGLKGKDRVIQAIWTGCAYEVLSTLEGETWASKYWKQWDDSIASAKALGYTFVCVQLTEVTPLR